MLVERDGLARELPAEPGRLLDQHGVGPALDGGQRRGHAAEASADDEHRGPVLAHRAQRVPPGCEATAGRRNVPPGID